VLLFQTHAYLAVLGLIVSLGMRGRHLIEGPVLASSAFFALLTTAATHAAFFGSGRYSMVVFPLVTALGVAFLPKEESATEHRILTAGTAGRDTEETNEETSKCP
jgi:hypothetical protein